MPSSADSLLPPPGGVPSSPPDTPAPFPPRNAPAGSETLEHSTLKHFSSILTHKLSTLTSTISGYADLLVDTPSVQEQRQIAMNVLEATTQIDDLLADLRYFSRPLHPVLRPVAAYTVARDAVALLDAPDHKRIDLTVETSQQNEMIEADEQLLRQALLGLLQNALEATSSSSVRFHVSLSERQDDDTRVAFEVWNEGVIALDDPENVFQPFYTTRARQLGLGLPIARNIAALHGGSLRLASSNADDGTRFVLHI